jgi:hypothetical protein
MLKPRQREEMPFPCTGLRPVRSPASQRRQGGSFAVMTAVLILVILGVCGFAIDLSRMYNRKVELQSIADTIALAAAAELDGTTAGITRSRAAAAEAAARNPFFNYNNLIDWSEDALRYSAAPSGRPWVGADDASGQAPNMFFVEVDTSKLDERHGRVSMLLLQVVSSANATADVASRAVAGRSTINVLPLAVCAMTDTPAISGVSRNGELVEYGFRRGVSYNLMQLNPKNDTTPANFLINPFALPGTTGASVAANISAIQPYVCTGTLGIPRIDGEDITVDHGFPLASVYNQLNSRFGTYDAPCVAVSAPSDTNVKEYTPAVAKTWMFDQPSGQAAARRTPPGRMVTIADLAASDIEATATPDLYGPLWIYARAAKFTAAYKQNGAEPSAGYATYAPADWSTLYTPGLPKVATAGYTTPAKTITEAPPGGGRTLADRRILNVPLLQGPVPAGSPAAANVMGIGKFYMTAKATSTDLYGEFVGLVRQEALVGQVELYR